MIDYQYFQEQGWHYSQVNEFADYLTDLYGTATVCGQEYDQGRLLAMVDPIAFRLGMAEYFQEQEEQGEE